MSTVIGVHDGHNASVAVVRDGRVEFALQEERITRVKNQGDVPKNALAAALHEAGTGARVALNGRYMNYGQWGRETILEDYGRSSSVVSRLKQPLKGTFVDRAYQRRKGALREERLGIGRERLEVVEHHLAHASAAYYTCPWPDGPVLVVTCDGSGDRVCATVSIGDRGKLTRLAQILEVAVEYGHIDKNTAKGKRRRVKSTEPKRTWVEPEQLMALIDAADRDFRPVVATLSGAGLRVGEAVALDWRDVNLSTGTLIVRESKTAAGEGREVDLPIGLREELATWRARSPRTAPTDPVFVSRERNGQRSRQTPRNVQARLRTAVKAANEALKDEGIEEIGSVSPHSLRRTYASLRAALRDDPIFIAEQLGHKDARFTFRIYQRAAKRRQKLSGRYLEAFDAALVWAHLGARGETEQFDPFPVLVAEDEITASESQN